jgi:hypothetical protein
VSSLESLQLTSRYSALDWNWIRRSLEIDEKFRVTGQMLRIGLTSRKLHHRLKTAR